MENGVVRRRFEAYLDLSRDIDRQIERLERVQAAAASPSAPSLSGMPGGAGVPSDRVGRSVSLADELQGTIAEMIAREKAERRALEDMMACLKANEKAVLRTRYIDAVDTWETAAETLDMSEKGARNIANRAFERMEVLYGSSL